MIEETAGYQQIVRVDWPFGVMEGSTRVFKYYVALGDVASLF